MAYLMNAEIASMDRETWDFLIGRGWFPFIGLPRRISWNLVGFARPGIDLAVVLPEVVEAVGAAVPRFREAWTQSELFGPHRDLLLRALERFEAGDYRFRGIVRQRSDLTGDRIDVGPSIQSRRSPETHREPGSSGRHGPPS